MRYLTHQIVFREIPNEVSLSFLITGCPERCPGCHSHDSWSARKGEELTDEKFLSLIEKYNKWITCVLFLGGEWAEAELVERLEQAQLLNLKTALYTGKNEISDRIKLHLNYLKIGPYISQLGGLESKETNQKLINLTTGEVLNYYFSSEGSSYDQINTGAN